MITLRPPKAVVIRVLAEEGMKPRHIAALMGVTSNFVRQVLWKARHPQKNAARQRKYQSNYYAHLRSQREAGL